MSFSISDALGASGFAHLYKPKAQKLTVGIELAPISTSSLSAPGNRNNLVVADGDDVSFSSLKIFNLARQTAQSGIQVANFRSVDVIHSDLKNC